MTPTIAVAGVCGAGMGLGLWLIVTAWLERNDPPSPGRSRWRERWRWLRTATTGRRLLGTLAAGLLVGLITGWPVGAVMAAVGIWSAPALLGRNRAAADPTRRIEAIAAWTQMLRDTIAAAAGLQQAITATAATAPEPLHAPVQRLVARLERGGRLDVVLRQFADEVDDPLADLVVLALIQAATQQAGRLGEVLSTLAETARDQAALRHKARAAQASTRTSVRVIIATTSLMAAALIVLDRRYLQPFDSPTGQLVLAIVGALFAAGYIWLARLADRTPTPARILNATGRPTTAGRVAAADSGTSAASSANASLGGWS